MPGICLLLLLLFLTGGRFLLFPWILFLRLLSVFLTLYDLYLLFFLRMVLFAFFASCPFFGPAVFFLHTISSMPQIRINAGFLALAHLLHTLRVVLQILYILRPLDPSPVFKDKLRGCPRARGQNALFFFHDQHIIDSRFPGFAYPTFSKLPAIFLYRYR